MWNGEMIIIKDGQFLAGRKELSKETGIPETTIETILSFFEKEGQIRQQKTTKFRIITVLNWKQYQVEKEFGQQTDNRRTTDGQQSDTNKNKENIEKEKKTTFPEISSEYQLSLHLFNGIRSNDPKAKEPNFQKWACEIDKLIRIDKRTPDEIARVIDFSQTDDFWKSNILSTSTLRRQFPKLLLKAKNGTATNRPGYRYNPEKFRRLAEDFKSNK